jgi:transcriptional regulator with XRE-family HTH domain
VSGTREKSSILVQLGQTVSARRKELMLSQEALAHLAGIDRSHMGKIERGERNVTLLNIEKIAFALKVAPSALLAEAGF